MKKLPWDSKKVVERAQGRYVREKSADLYHTARWTRLSRTFRQAHPLCEECKRNGKITPAEVTDHIIPFPVCGKDGFFNEDNLQALCHNCNHEKGQRDKKIIQQWREIQQLQRR